MADDDLDIDVNEGGATALKAEMAVSEFMLRYWIHLTVAVVIVIVGIFSYGQYTSWMVDAQRATTSAIADVEASLDADLLTLAQAKAGVRPGTEINIEEVKAGADKLTEIAMGASGTSATEAWLKAAELYRIADDTAQRRAALEKASAGTKGVLRYAAEAALANLDLEEDKADAALARFQALRADPNAFLARQATLDLAGAYETLGRHGDAVATYDAYLATWSDAPDIEDVQARRVKASEQAG